MFLFFNKNKPVFDHRLIQKHHHLLDNIVLMMIVIV